MSMNARQIAKALGRRGGLARARRLSAERRQEIAALGGMVKALSAKAAQRIEKNFKYLEVVKQFQQAPKPKSVSRVSHPLPGIYAQDK